MLIVRLVHRELVHRHIERHVPVERDQPLRNARDLGIVDQRLPAFVLLDLTGALEQCFEISVFADQLRRGLDADAGHARHVVAGIADQRLHLDHFLRADAEFLDHLGAPDAAVLHGVVHGDAIADELHQVLVGGHDGCRRFGFGGEPRIGRDQIVGLEAGLLQAGDLKSVHRLADERELRNEIFRRVRPVRLVFGIKIAAEGLLGFVEHHREMRGLVILHLGQELPQHVAEAEHGIDLQAVRLAGKRRQRVIGAEDIAGAVHQEQVVALLEQPRRRVRCGRGCGFGLGFGACRHGPNVGRQPRIINPPMRACGRRAIPPAAATASAWAQALEPARIALVVRTGTWPGCRVPPRTAQASR